MLLFRFTIFFLLLAAGVCFAFYIGNDPVIIVTGRLVDKNGEPVAFKTVTATSANDSKAPPITFFTNKKGKFQIQMLIFKRVMIQWMYLKK